jgi:hypothetical protein
MMERKRILIDLDVVTVALWDKRDERRNVALNFIERINNKEFEVITLSSTLNLVDKWRHLTLGNSIKQFYIENTSHFIDEIEILEYLQRHKISSNQIIDEILSYNIKREDVMLILACISTKVKFLVTLNRKHLKGKVKEINKVINNYKLHDINIVYPNEI